MPTGLKQASSVVSIGFIAEETAANTFIQNSVDLNLSPLDREVFVVLAVNLDPASPDSLAATDTSVQTSLTTTSQTAVVGLDNPNCLAATTNIIRADGFADSGVAFQGLGIETPPATLQEQSPFVVSCMVIAQLQMLTSTLHLFRAKSSVLEVDSHAICRR